MTSDNIESLSTSQINHTKTGYVEIREGFTPSNPNVGTLTHEFEFATDPWKITAKDGAVLCILSTIKISLSKVFNNNNITDSFYMISWIPIYNYNTVFNGAPKIVVNLLDVNGAGLDEGKLGELEGSCGFSSQQAKKRKVDAIYFDRVNSCVFSLAPGAWTSCQI